MPFFTFTLAGSYGKINTFSGQLDTQLIWDYYNNKRYMTVPLHLSKTSSNLHHHTIQDEPTATEGISQDFCIPS